VTAAELAYLYCLKILVDNIDFPFSLSLLFVILSNSLLLFDHPVTVPRLSSKYAKERHEVCSSIKEPTSVEGATQRTYRR
jgi:hypothetical protein